MPELPEVEVVRRGLEPAVSGALIAGVEVFEPRSLRRHDRSRGDFADAILGRTLTAAVRRGKFLWLPLARNAEDVQPAAVVAHLGMSGQLLLREPGTADDPQLRVRMQLEHPQLGEIWLNFADQRIFGSLAVEILVDTSDGLPAGRGSDSPLIPVAVSHIARDPLDPNFDDRSFARAVRRSRSGIKRLLLNQNLISGIGNIYADESLWAARIHYEQPGESLSPARIDRLLHAVREVLDKALAEGGTSFDAQYVNVNGASGYFSHSLNVYGQQGRPCPRCGTGIVREPFMNRSSHFCPHCQRLRAMKAPAR